MLQWLKILNYIFFKCLKSLEKILFRLLGLTVEKWIVEANLLMGLPRIDKDVYYEKFVHGLEVVLQQNKK